MTENPVLKKLDEFGEAVLDMREDSRKQFEQLRERLELVESKGERPRGTDGGGTSDEREHKSKFLAWIRRPNDHQTKHILGEAQAAMEKKAVIEAVNASGGFAVPTLIAANIERRVTTLNPFRKLVEVVSVGSSDFKRLISKNSASSGWAAESGTRSETTTSDLVSAKPTFGVLYSYPKASEESLQDIFFNVQRWLEEETADGFAAAEAQAIWNGNGSARPSGLKNTTPTSADDNASPERAATALEYIATGSSPISSAPNGDDLIELMYTVKTGYLAGDGVAWVMNRATARGIRALKDTTGNYLWERSLQAGQPEMLLGFPVFLTDVIDTIATNAFPVAFGNFRRGYILADHAAAGLRITVDEVTAPGFTKFYIRKRVGGIVTNNEAIKLLKCAAS